MNMQSVILDATSSTHAVLMLLLAFLAELRLCACWHRNIWRVIVVKNKSLENSKNRQIITFTLALVARCHTPINAF